MVKDRNPFTQQVVQQATDSDNFTDNYFRFLHFRQGVRQFSSEFYTPTYALLYTIKYKSKTFILKHLKTFQRVSISFRSSSGSSYIPY